MYKLLLFLFYFITIIPSNAQVPDADTTVDKKPAAFSQFSLGTGLGSASATPKITLNSYRFSALVGNGFWDFYLFNSVPTIGTAEGDSEQYLRGDLVRQLGGLLNISMSKVGYFAYGKDPEDKEMKGAQIDFRLGMKAIDVANRRKGNSFLIPILQSSVDLRYLIPLVLHDQNYRTGQKINLKDKMIGNLSFRFLGTIMQVLDQSIYGTYYTSRKGVPASPTIFTGTGEIYFYVSNQIYINAGYTFTNQELIAPVPFLSISYGAKK